MPIHTNSTSHAHAFQRADRPGPGVPRDAAAVPEHVPVAAAAAGGGGGEEGLEGAVWLEHVRLDALWEDGPQEVVLLQHLVRCQSRRVARGDADARGRGGGGSGEEEE